MRRYLTHFATWKVTRTKNVNNGALIAEGKRIRFSFVVDSGCVIQFRLCWTLHSMPGAHCVVVGCTNGSYKLRKWREELCPVHNINYGIAHCVCEPPFKLFTFPTVLKDNDGRKRWIRAVSHLLLSLIHVSQTAAYSGANMLFIT